MIVISSGMIVKLVEVGTVLMKDWRMTGKHSVSGWLKQQCWCLKKTRVDMSDFYVHKMILIAVFWRYIMCYRFIYQSAGQRFCWRSTLMHIFIIIPLCFSLKGKLFTGLVYRHLWKMVAYKAFCGSEAIWSNCLHWCHSVLWGNMAAMFWKGRRMRGIKTGDVSGLILIIRF